MRKIPLISLIALACIVTASAKEETVTIYQQHRVSIDVPEGFTYSSQRDGRGIISVKLADPKSRIDLIVSFLPDTRGRLASETEQKNFIADACQHFAESSVEQSYGFEKLRPRVGSGLYCVFTDKDLVGKRVPPGEYLHVTSGVKSWPGCFLVFTLMSNDTKSPEYETALRLLKDSFEETRREEAI